MRRFGRMPDVLVLYIHKREARGLAAPEFRDRGRVCDIQILVLYFVSFSVCILLNPHESPERSTNGDMSRRKGLIQEDNSIMGDNSSMGMALSDQQQPTEGHIVGSQFGEDTAAYTKRKDGRLDACLYRSCLHPKLSLRNQLFLSFGLVSTLSLGVLIVTAFLTIQQAGQHVKQLSRENLEQATEERN